MNIFDLFGIGLKISVAEEARQRLSGKTLDLEKVTITFPANLKVTSDPVARTLSFSPPALVVSKSFPRVGRTSLSGVRIGFDKIEAILDNFSDYPITIDWK